MPERIRPEEEKPIWPSDSNPDSGGSSFSNEPIAPPNSRGVTLPLYDPSSTTLPGSSMPSSSSAQPQDQFSSILEVTHLPDNDPPEEDAADYGDGRYEGTLDYH